MCSIPYRYNLYCLSASIRLEEVETNNSVNLKLTDDVRINSGFIVFKMARNLKLTQSVQGFGGYEY